MSSFIGVVGGNESVKEKISQLFPKPDFSFQHQSLFLCVDAHPQTTHFQVNPDQQSGWIVCGIGISSGENARVLLQQDWQSCFENNTDVQTELDGHFAIAKWDLNKVELITDQIGMRNIFIHRNNEFTLFSTRLDWMTKLLPDLSINWNVFGSYWLGINPFSSECIINGVDRLAQGGKASITLSDYMFSNKRWTPKAHSGPDMEQALVSVFGAALRAFSETSLGLSGGMDSRVLFASLLGMNSDSWGLYTFDNVGHPDTEISMALNQPFGKQHCIIPLTLPRPDELIHTIKELSVRSQFSTTLASLPGLLGYKLLGKKGIFTIDGGFGEIGRRRYLRGVELREGKNLSKWSAERLFPYFQSTKADIFSDEVMKAMKSGFKETFEDEFLRMPKVQDVGIGNWLDLFTIRTRAQNLYGSAQGISDEILFHYMPFLQPSFLNALFCTPVEVRHNGTLFRSVIQKNAPELSKIKLVKGDETYPFWMKDISAMGWMKAKQKLGLSFKNQISIKLICSLESFTKDLISSQSFKECELYDQNKVNTLVSDFFDNRNYSLAAQLEWLISFEIFRKQL